MTRSRALSPGHPHLAEIEKALTAVVTPELVVEAIEAAKRALTATRSFLVKGGEVHVMQDHATQLRAVEIILSWGVGKPVERQLIINRTEKAEASGLSSLEALIEGSPAFAEAYANLYERAKAKAIEP